MTKVDQIARDHLHIKTLKPRNSDRHDFHSVGVVNVKQALEAAYRAGQIDLLAAMEMFLKTNENA